MKILALFFIFYFIFILIKAEVTEFDIDNEFYPPISQSEITSKQLIEIQLKKAEGEFWNNSSKFSRRRKSENFILSVHNLIKEFCHHVHIYEKNEEIILTNKTKIIIGKILLNYAQENESMDSVIVETEGLRRSYNDTDMSPSFKMNLTTTESFWQDENNDIIYNLTCYVVIHYNLPLKVDELAAEDGPSWEAMIIFTSNSFPMGTWKYFKEYTPVTLSLEIDTIPHHSNATCGRFIQELGAWNIRVCQINTTYDDNVVECVCSSLGFYKLIYLDFDTRNANASRIVRQSVSFWINSTYEETIAECRTEFEELFLSQILTQLGYENSTWKDNVNLTLDHGVINDTILVTLTFGKIKTKEKYDNEWFQMSYNGEFTALGKFISKLEKALLSGTLSLEYFNNSLLLIPIQSLKRNPDNLNQGRSYDPESIFLWIVFTIVMVLSIGLMTFAIRKHQKDYEDSVQPITFQSEEFRTVDDSIVIITRAPYRRATDTGNIEGVSSIMTRSMTTMLSNSIDSADNGIGEKRLSTGSVTTVESMSPKKQSKYELTSPLPPRRMAFEVTSSLPDLADDEEDMNGIYYIPPTPEDDDYEHTNGLPI